MRRVEPKVHVVAETRIDHRAMDKYLASIGAEDGVFLTFDETTGDLPHSSSEMLTEFMGRLCYRSWKPELNPNVTKVREGNDTYLDNILKVKHGSVIEHCSMSFVFQDVSRVFTHELVRHRVGVAISQESLRYVRLTDLGLWLPACIEQEEKMMKCDDCDEGTRYIGDVDLPTVAVKCSSCQGRGDYTAAQFYEYVFRTLENYQHRLAEHFELDKPGTPFDKKKEITSAMRRIAPIGLATTIGWTANVRTLRFVLPLRTHNSAEEEMRFVFDRVGLIAQERWPNLFDDFTRTEVKGIGEWTSPNWKV